MCQKDQEWKVRHGVGDWHAKESGGLPTKWRMKGQNHNVKN